MKNDILKLKTVRRIFSGFSFLVVLFTFSFLVFTFKLSLAAPPEDSTPPGQVKKEDIKDKIEDLKERLATRVAELRAKSKRAFFGQIKEKSEQGLTLVRGEKEMIVTIDEETGIIRVDLSNKRTEDSLEALKIGEQIVVFGTLDLDQKTLLAKRILSRALPKNIHGKVTEVDIDAATLTVSQNPGLTWVIDYEIRTKCFLWEKGKELTKCGLSKIQIGDRVFVRGTVNQKDSTLLTALRLLVLPSKSPALSPAPSE